MKRIFILAFLAAFALTNGKCTNGDKEKGSTETVNANKTVKSVGAETNNLEVIHLNKETFKQLVFDYEANKEWKYNGDKPAILDFYADWCGPCKMLSPLLEELQAEYKGKIQVFKVNTDKERELASVFGIQSLPTIVFIPIGEKPSASMGFIPKEELEKQILNVLKVSK